MSGEEHDAQLAELLVLDGGAGPARKISAAGADALIFGALDAAAAHPLPAAGTQKPRAFLAIAAGIAFALFTGGAIAAIYLNTREPSVEPAPVPQKSPSATEPPLAEIIPPEVAPPEVAPPVEETREAIDQPPPASPKSTRPPAEDLLAQANALRGQERWAAAEKAYSKVVRLHPHTQAAYVAAIAAGSLRLEHLSNPRGALEMFDQARAIEPRGALDADVLFGIAAAHRATNDVAREKAALQSLLKKHARSVFAPGAKRRLAELEERR